MIKEKEIELVEKAWEKEEKPKRQQEAVISPVLNKED